MTRYAELQAASNFSFLRGASHPGELIVGAAALGMDAIGICDRNSLAGVVRAWSARRELTESGSKIRDLTGCRLDFADGTPQTPRRWPCLPDAGARSVAAFNAASRWRPGLHLSDCPWLGRIPWSPFA